ncbi:MULTISPECIES: endonuclease [Streptomyces]|uniref:Endonuclease III n=2 Tax=Streptomyces TaxID=1883 RepID=A0AA89QGP6_STRCU|nr:MULTISPECIES: endonuclease [Streptomyces]MBB5815300.1 endonuclease III [Streptomyces collinus]MEC7058171.1 endonuclease [Streptomyces violaceochromogenes]WMX68236.1 endonuclease [Streptomyces collinus]GHC49516.1 endonuclease [Streptomyces violaceochromogenes]
MGRRERVVRELVGAHGRTYAEEAGIALKDTPQPLYRLLVLSHLLSARIRGSVALATARALHEAGLRDPRRMAEAGWQQRVDALGRGGYRRYDERTATQLGDAAGLLSERWGGDLRRLRREADGKVSELRRLLQEFPGIGPAGADIFLREAQGVWPEAAPYLDTKALQGAERLDLPKDPERLTDLAGDTDPAVLAAALVRAALDKGVAEDTLRRAG